MNLLASYQKARFAVVAAGYQSDIEWSESLANVETTPTYVLREGAWVIVNSGFRYAVARKLWPRMFDAFAGFEPDVVMERPRVRRARALRVLRHEKKIDAILRLASIVASGGTDAILLDAKDPPKLTRLPYIGKITCWHYAKVLGIDCVKPDVHLSRAAKAAGFDTPFALCESIRRESGHRLTVIDSVLWRYGEQQRARGWKDWEALFR